MDDLLEQMQKAISSSSTSGVAAQKCKEIAKQYTLKILDGMTYYKSKDGNLVYTNIVKTMMAVKSNEI
jgi:hypothetical protein